MAQKNKLDQKVLGQNDIAINRECSAKETILILSWVLKTE